MPVNWRSRLDINSEKANFAAAIQTVGTKNIKINARSEPQQCSGRFLYEEQQTPFTYN